MITTLDELQKGDTATVFGYLPSSHAQRLKLLALGFTKGTKIKLSNIAPLGNPLQIDVQASSISLRRNEAAIIQVETIDKPA